MRVLLAFDKFKDSLTAREACVAAARGLRAAHPHWQCDLAPLADGGDGFATVLSESVGGERVPVRVHGPRGGLVEAPLGLVPVAALPAAVRARLPALLSAPEARLAVVEMAAASGLALLDPSARDPWHTTSLGTGQLLRAAGELGAAAVLLGVGGSATHDLGLGALAALGFEFRDAGGARLRPPVPATWERIVHLQGEMFPGVPPVFIACDVENPLLGPRGAAAVFGPQKGLRAEDVARLEAASAAMAEKLCQHTGRPRSLVDTPGAGAAGGLPFGLLAAAQATLVPGADLVAEWLRLDERLAAADLVLTGEGRFDASSLGGKGPGMVIARARAAGKRVVAFAGAVDAAAAATVGIEAWAISPPDMPLPEALRYGARSLEATVRARL